MQQLTIQIDDAQVQFITELLKKFDFVKINENSENGNTIKISSKQIELIEIERKKAKEDPTYMLEWGVVSEKLLAD